MPQEVLEKWGMAEVDGVKSALREFKKHWTNVAIAYPRVFSAWLLKIWSRLPPGKFVPEWALEADKPEDMLKRFRPVDHLWSYPVWVRDEATGDRRLDYPKRGGKGYTPRVGPCNLLENPIEEDMAPAEYEVVAQICHIEATALRGAPWASG